MEWYPRNKDLLEKALNEYFEKSQKNSLEKINGLIVPHAGYVFSGEIAGKSFSLVKNRNFENAIIIAPSHYEYFNGIKTIEKIETPLGKIDIKANEYQKLKYEHAIDNQIPFLQKIGIKEILPLVIGEINENQIKEIAEKIIQEIDKTPQTILIVSTDLSHFLDYETANKTDYETIKIIKNLELEESEKINACGKYPLLILIEICKQKNWQPKLIEYKNSGDIIGDKSKVVGYASFIF